MNGDVLTFLGVLFSATLGLLGLLLTSAIRRRAEREAQEAAEARAKAEAEAEERAARLAADAVTLGHVVQRMRDQDEKIAAQQTQIDGQRTELDRMHDHTREQDRAIQALQRTEGRLVGWVARLHHGVADGTIPPLPDIPDWLTGLLSRRPHDD